MWQFHLLMGSMIQNNPIKILNLITLPLTFLPSIRILFLAVLLAISVPKSTRCGVISQKFITKLHVRI
uniref:Uncharacterized protein n=1 Tax=Cannabis sativa TaxID=3483 RepID=A0A803R486_CANSA